jgi:putative Flp pilus-assembly TadE/G-like protein
MSALAIFHRACSRSGHASVRRPALIRACGSPGQASVPGTLLRRACGCAGQASVELVGLLPLVLAVGLAVIAVVTAHSAHEQAGAAAEAGAVAILQDRDPRAAARAALPPAVRPHARISVTGTVVRVRVRPRVPLLAARLIGTAAADAGPGAGGSHSHGGTGR